MSNELISPFKIDRNFIKEFSYTFDDKEIVGEKVEILLKANYEMAKFQKIGDDTVGNINLIIEVKGVCIGNEVFKIYLNMQGIFSAPSEIIDEKSFKDLLLLNGLTVLMQLSRAYITANTALAGFKNPINIPMINIYELVKDEYSQQ